MAALDIVPVAYQKGPDENAPPAMGRFSQQADDAGEASDSNIDIAPFVGRMGGNGASPSGGRQLNEQLLKAIPDAAPLATLGQIFDLRPFRTAVLWKSALIEGMGTLMLVWLTVYANASPAGIPATPTQRWGNFDNAAFIGPVIGGLLNFLYLTLFTFSFGAVSGAHLNPTITIATLLAGLCSFPRAVLYVSAQTAGGAIGGMLARASFGGRDFKTGGCWLYPDVVATRDAFTVEFMTCTILLFFAFGVGLDPRQRHVVGPTLGPFLVGLALGSLTLGTAFTRYGYGGASLNPARCFGAFVGSRFAAFHWVHWVADIAACGVHAVIYHVVPPRKAL